MLEVCYLLCIYGGSHFSIYNQLQGGLNLTTYWTW